jgi:hypothetical protein
MRVGYVATQDAGVGNIGLVPLARMAMEEGHPSVTAEGAAVMRALHQTPDHDPKILDDPVSVRLVDTQSDFYRSRLDHLRQLPTPTRLRLEATFVMRSRYTEDCLSEAFGAGVRQYVLLGAGLDTFAYRQPSWAILFESLRLTIRRLSNGSVNAWLTRVSLCQETSNSYP